MLHVLRSNILLSDNNRQNGVSHVGCEIISKVLGRLVFETGQWNNIHIVAVQKSDASSTSDC